MGMILYGTPMCPMGENPQMNLFDYDNYSDHAYGQNPQSWDWTPPLDTENSREQARRQREDFMKRVNEVAKETAEEEREKEARKRMEKISGVGKDTPTTTNKHGGKQSESPARLDLLPVRAILAVGKVLQEGEKKYGRDNWCLISARDHINHALIHLMALLDGDNQDDHLEHAACRILMALEMAKRMNTLDSVETHKKDCPMEPRIARL